MIIGSGFIAKNFIKKKHLIKKYNLAIYASGVSNSQSKKKTFFLKKTLNFQNCIAESCEFEKFEKKPVSMKHSKNNNK